MSTVLTIDEAADHLGVSTTTIRSWVLRGHVEPITRGVKPLRFREQDITRCEADRLTTAERTRLDTLWSRVLDAPEAQLQR